MLGSSRTSQRDLLDRLDAIWQDDSLRPFLADSGVGVLSVVDTADHEHALRSLWSDTATAAEVKNGVLEQLFGQRIPLLAQDVAKGVIDARWSDAADMMDGLEDAGASLLFMSAEAEGRVDQVEEELFRFGRTITGSDDLQLALTDPATPPSVKQGIVQELLDGKVDFITETLLVHLSGNLRGRRMTTAIEHLSDLAAVRRNRIVAEVTSGIPLTDEQRDKLAAALSRIQGRQVLINVTVDPAVVGGIEVRIGDEVIDGTLSNRIEQARRRLTS